MPPMEWVEFDVNHRNKYKYSKQVISYANNTMCEVNTKNLCMRVCVWGEIPK